MEGIIICSRVGCNTSLNQQNTLRGNCLCSECAYCSIACTQEKNTCDCDSCQRCQIKSTIYICHDCKQRHYSCTDCSVRKASICYSCDKQHRNQHQETCNGCNKSFYAANKRKPHCGCVSCVYCDRNCFHATLCGCSGSCTTCGYGDYCSVCKERKNNIVPKCSDCELRVCGECNAKHYIDKHEVAKYCGNIACTILVKPSLGFKPSCPCESCIYCSESCMVKRIRSCGCVPTCESCTITPKLFCNNCKLTETELVECIHCAKQICFACKQSHYRTQHEQHIYRCSDSDCANSYYDDDCVYPGCGCKRCGFCSEYCMKGQGKDCGCRFKCKRCPNSLRNNDKRCRECTKDTDAVSCVYCPAWLCHDCQRGHYIRDHLGHMQLCSLPGCTTVFNKALERIPSCKCPNCRFCQQHNANNGCNCPITCVSCPSKVNTSPIPSKVIEKDIAAKNEDELCIVCMDAPPTHVAIPCGHQVTCAKCSGMYPLRPCIICRKPVTSVIKVYKS
jgi:hypothetical protein